MQTNYTTTQLFQAFKDLERHRLSYSQPAEQIALFDAVHGETFHRDLTTQLRGFSDAGIAFFVDGIASSSTSESGLAEELARVGVRYLELRDEMDASFHVLSFYGITGRMDTVSMVDLKSPIYVVGENEEVLTAPQAIVARMRRGGLVLPAQFNRVVSLPVNSMDGYFEYNEGNEVQAAAEMLALLGLIVYNERGEHNRAYADVPFGLWDGRKAGIFSSPAEFDWFKKELIELTR